MGGGKGRLSGTPVRQHRYHTFTEMPTTAKATDDCSKQILDKGQGPLSLSLFLSLGVSSPTATAETTSRYSRLVCRIDSDNIATRGCRVDKGELGGDKKGSETTVHGLCLKPTVPVLETDDSRTPKLLVA